MYLNRHLQKIKSTVVSRTADILEEEACRAEREIELMTTLEVFGFELPSEFNRSGKLCIHGNKSSVNTNDL